MASGVHVMSPDCGSIVMPAGAVVRAYDSGLPSGSDATTWYWYGEPATAGPSGVEVMTGGALGGAASTGKVNDCVALPPVPFCTTITICCEPRSPACGVQVRRPLAASIDMDAGAACEQEGVWRSRRVGDGHLVLIRVVDQRRPSGSRRDGRVDRGDVRYDREVERQGQRAAERMSLT